jgi:hypothetical protein
MILAAPAPAGDPVSASQVLWAVAVVAFSFVPLGLSGWAFLDAARRPQWAWALSRHRQVVWLALVLFGVLTVIGGLAISAWYLARIRPALVAIEHGDLDRLPHGQGPG